METQKRVTHQNWRIEEAEGDKPSESALIIVYPYVDLQGISELAKAMYTPHLKRVHIVFDLRVRAVDVWRYMDTIHKALPNLEYVVKHTDADTIALIEYLWHRLCDYCAKRRK